jgi:hypothetical protein
MPEENARREKFVGEDFAFSRLVFDAWEKVGEEISALLRRDYAHVNRELYE